MSVNFNYYPQEPTDVYGRCVLPCLDCKVKETEISRLKMELELLKCELKEKEKDVGTG